MLHWPLSVKSVTRDYWSEMKLGHLLHATTNTCMEYHMDVLKTSLTWPLGNAALIIPRILIISCETADDSKHKTSLMISRHWFRWWLGAVRQQAITWTNVDQVLLRQMSHWVKWSMLHEWNIILLHMSILCVIVCVYSLWGSRHEILPPPGCQFLTSLAIHVWSVSSVIAQRADKSEYP